MLLTSNTLPQAPFIEPPESPDEERIPLLQVKKTKKPHPFVKMLFGIIPFGPSFRDLGLLGKIYEIIKVIGRQVLVVLWVNPGSALYGPEDRVHSLHPHASFHALLFFSLPFTYLLGFPSSDASQHSPGTNGPSD